MAVTILSEYNSISLLHTLLPFLLRRFERRFRFTGSLDYCLRDDANRTLIIVRFFKRRYDRVEENTRILTQLRDRYEKIVFFDDSDGADSLHPLFFEFADLYWKKQILADQSHYCRPMYGRQFFADYYHRKHGIVDENERIRPAVPQRHLAKLRIAWNLGVGSYPRSGKCLCLVANSLFGPRVARHLFKDPVRFRNNNRGRFGIQARFQVAPVATIGFQRRMLLEKVRGHRQFLTGHVRRRAFYREMSSSRIVLSPFGSGEICFRDFEAILFRALLLKPDMSHIRTWPNVYHPYETYVPIDWDGADLMDVAEEYLGNGRKRRELVENAVHVYQRSLEQLEQRVESLLNDPVLQAGP